MKTTLFLLLLCCSACSLDVQKLPGHWQANAFFENGQSSSAPLNDVALDFFPSGRYVFHSSAHYSEAGTFRDSGHYLFLTDTTADPVKVRKIKVLYLSEDSLKIKMEKLGQEQILFLYHQPVEAKQ